MSSVEDRLIKLREERLAREKARIEKLRELNLKKYNKNEPLQKHSSSISIANKSRSDPVANSKSSISNIANATKNNSGAVRNNFHVNGTTKRPISATLRKTDAGKDMTGIQKPNSGNVIKKDVSKVNKVDTKPTHCVNKPTLIPKAGETKTTNNADKSVKKDVPSLNKASEPAKNVKIDGHVTNKSTDPIRNMARKSLAPKSMSALPKPSLQSRKSLLPAKIDSRPPQKDTKLDGTKESVFDRLYKLKQVAKKQTDEVTKLQTDPNYLKKVLKDSGLIMNKRHTVFDFKPKAEPLVRRSISAVHFKRISKNELTNCIHKWSSIGEKIDKVHLNDIDEDEGVKQDKVISAIKSERKRVKFQTPVPSNFNTPRPEELQSRLKSWLQKRGKSLDSYHHLQCFGLHHISHKVKPIDDTPKFELYDDEDKENIAVEHDSDNDSFDENVKNNDADVEHVNGGFDMERDTWRHASFSSTCDLNESRLTAASDAPDPPALDLVLAALNDLAQLLREGFDWEQCARYLRAIRERFPRARETAAYWECRAALEETRGDLPASVRCWEEAVAKGTERTVVEANLDQLLDKFMQLKISPSSGKRKRVDPKMVDVKNVFKSTIIRFAVQQAKLRNSNESVKYTVTPVRRSGRLSVHGSARRTPLQQVCTSVRRIDLPGPLVFVPNDKLCETP